MPGTDQAPGGELGGNANPVLAGKLVRSDGQPANLPGAWPQFRGPNRDGISRETVSLARAWQPSEPRELWAIDVGEGYAGAAVLNGRVYLMDYDRDQKQDALRCLSLADGREIWRYAYPRLGQAQSRHVADRAGASPTSLSWRWIPSAMSFAWTRPRANCAGAWTWSANTGRPCPPWYAGQCPLIDNGAVILAPGGKAALLLACDAQTGAALWQTPNPHGWKMTHSSVMPMEFDGQRMYVYCANNGVVGVSAKDGSILWETTDWKISIATVPSPLILSDGRIFLTGGYNAGSLMLQLRKEGDRLVPQTLFKLEPEVFGATQHTPDSLGRPSLWRARRRQIRLPDPGGQAGLDQRFRPAIRPGFLHPGRRPPLRHERQRPVAPDRGDAREIRAARPGAGIERPRVLGAAGAGGGAADRPRPDADGLPGRRAALRISNTQQPTSNIQHPKTAQQVANGCSMLDVGCWMFWFNALGRRIRPIEAQHLDIARVVAAEDGSEIAGVAVDRGRDVHPESLAAHVAELLKLPYYSRRDIGHTASLPLHSGTAQAYQGSWDPAALDAH